MPLTMFCASLPVPTRFMPLVSDTYTSAPINDPTMLPTPPRVDVPPEIALAFTSKTTSIYLEPLRVTTSNMTANTSTAPRTTYCRAMSVPMRFMPLVNDI